MTSIVPDTADTSDVVPVETAPASPPSPAPVVLPPGTVACEQCSVPVAKARLSEHEQFECPFALFACPFSRDTFGYPHCHTDEYATRADTLAHVTESLPLHVLYLLDTVQALHNQLAEERNERIKAERRLSEALNALRQRFDQQPPNATISAQKKRAYSKHKLLRVNKAIIDDDGGMKDELVSNGLEAIIKSADDTKSPLLRLVPASSLTVPNGGDLHHMTPRGGDTLDAPLKVSEGGWRPISRITRSATSPPQAATTTAKSILNPAAARPALSSVDPNDLAAVTKQMRSILNKMTATTYDKLSASLLTLLQSIQSELHLSQLTQLIFDKALNDVFYAAMYAKLSHLLCDHLLPNEDRKGFKYYLLNQCQAEFEQGANAAAAATTIASTTPSSTTSTATDAANSSSSSTDTSAAESAPERNDEMITRLKAKRRMISCIRFIGELYVESLIGENIMTACILHLFHSIDTDTDIDALDEHSEGLSKLFLTIGNKFDNNNNKTRMNGLIQRIETVTNDSQRLSKRACFLLREVIDRRNHQWKIREATADQTAQQSVLQTPSVTTENDRSGHSDYRESGRSSSSSSHHQSHNNQHRSSSHSNRSSSRAISSPAPLPVTSMPPLFSGMSGLGAGASDFMALAMAQMQLQYSHALAINAAQSSSSHHQNNHRDSHHNDRRSTSYGRR